MNRRLLLRCLAAAAGMASVTVPWARAANASASAPLVFGVIAPSASEEETRKAWEPLAAKIQQHLGRPVRILASQDYKRIADGLVAGGIHVAWLSNAAALPAVESGKATVFAQMLVKGADGRPARGYEAVVAVRADSALHDEADLFRHASRLSFRVGPEKSTSGFLVPNYYLFAKRGIVPSRAFRTVATASHEENLRALLEGEADAVVNNSEELAKLAARDPAAARRLRVIWRSPTIAQSPLLVRRDLPEADKARIADAVLAFGKANVQERLQLLQMNNIIGFARSTNRQLIPIADIEMFEARTALLRRTDLPAEERARLERETIARASLLDLLLRDD